MLDRVWGLRRVAARTTTGLGLTLVFPAGVTTAGALLGPKTATRCNFLPILAIAFYSPTVARLLKLTPETRLDFLFLVLGVVLVQGPWNSELRVTMKCSQRFPSNVSNKSI